MGEEDSVDSANKEIKLDENQTDENLLEAGDDKPEVGEEGQEPEGQENEIVLPDDGSQPKPQRTGFQNRVNKLNARNDKSEGRATTAEAENETLRAQNQLYKLALEQGKKEPETALPPDPTDFDDGASDTKYVAALNAHNQAYIDAAFAKRDSVQQNAPQPVNANLERKQNAHYEAADKLGVKDYDETETKAVSILGKEAVNKLIAATNSSPRVLYYLGKNEGVAQDIAELIKSDPVAGILKLGALGAQLKVQPKAKTIVPDPDLELEGTTTGTNTALHRKLDKLREKATSGDQKDLKALIDFKRQNRAKMSA